MLPAGLYHPGPGKEGCAGEGRDGGPPPPEPVETAAGTQALRGSRAKRRGREGRPAPLRRISAGRALLPPPPPHLASHLQAPRPAPLPLSPGGQRLVALDGAAVRRTTARRRDAAAGAGLGAAACAGASRRCPGGQAGRQACRESLARSVGQVGRTGQPAPLLLGAKLAQGDPMKEVAALFGGGGREINVHRGAPSLGFRRRLSSAFAGSVATRQGKPSSGWVSGGRGSPSSG